MDTNVGFTIHDIANTSDNNSAEIDTEKYKIPESLRNKAIDWNTYLAGVQNPKLKEIEVFQVKEF